MKYLTGIDVKSTTLFIASRTLMDSKNLHGAVILILMLGVVGNLFQNVISLSD